MREPIDLEQQPKLRWPLDIQTVQVNAARCLVLTDPLGLALHPAVIPAELGPVLSRFDGSHTLRSILLQGAAAGLTEDILFVIVRGLNQLSLLDTPETREAMKRLRSDYHAETVRPATLADRVYPADGASLRELMQSFLDGAARFTVPDAHRGRVAALAAPHIDYQRGGQAYSAVCAGLAAAARPDVVLLFGTAHYSSGAPFHLTRKDFAVPTGKLACAREVVDEIAGAYGEERAFAEEILHRNEHSLELQIPFLVQRFEREGLPAIVPVLVGSFHKSVMSGKEPVEDEGIRSFIDAAAAAIRRLNAAGRSVMLYGGIDFAHVGTHFGDAQPMCTQLEAVAQRDHELLQTAAAADPYMLFRHIAEDQDRRRICGYPSLYTIYALMQACGWKAHGHVLHYQQSADEKTDCIVTFAALYWVV